MKPNIPSLGGNTEGVFKNKRIYCSINKNK
jgi:hypothetical protein